jgi:hypothetical protein
MMAIPGGADRCEKALHPLRSLVTGHSPMVEETSIVVVPVRATASATLAT